MSGGLVTYHTRRHTDTDVCPVTYHTRRHTDTHVDTQTERCGGPVTFDMPYQRWHFTTTTTQLKTSIMHYWQALLLALLIDIQTQKCPDDNHNYKFSAESPWHLTHRYMICQSSGKNVTLQSLSCTHSLYLLHSVSKKNATLFSTITLAFVGRFLHFSHQWKQKWILHNSV